MVALFTEMYGVPLTIYLLSGALWDKVGLSHNSGHLLNDLVGWRGNRHLSPFHLASYILIFCGLWLIESAWIRLHRSARAGRLATDGPYAHIRHPQYSGFAVIMTGFLLQWPTLLTLEMFPVLLVVYHRLALSEEREVEAVFGRAWWRTPWQHRGSFPARGGLSASDSSKQANTREHSMMLGSPNLARNYPMSNQAQRVTDSAGQARHQPLGIRRPGGGMRQSHRCAGHRGENTAAVGLRRTPKRLRCGLRRAAHRRFEPVRLRRGPALPACRASPDHVRIQRRLLRLSRSACERARRYPPRRAGRPSSGRCRTFLAQGPRGICPPGENSLIV